MEIDFGKVLEEIKNSSFLDDVRSFSIKTRKGEKRFYLKIDGKWKVRMENGKWFDRRELAVKLVYLVAKREGNLLEVEK